MMAAYMGGAALVALIGQQAGPEIGSAGADLLDQAIQQDMSITGIMTTAGQLMGVGVSVTEAAVIVAAAGIVYKLLQMATPFAETLNRAAR